MSLKWNGAERELVKGTKTGNWIGGGGGGDMTGVKSEVQVKTVQVP